MIPIPNEKETMGIIETVLNLKAENKALREALEAIASLNISGADSEDRLFNASKLAKDALMERGLILWQE